jgi:hypothetical protein
MLWSDDDYSWFSDFDEVSHDGFDDASTHDDFTDDMLSNNDDSTFATYPTIDDYDVATVTIPSDAELKVDENEVDAYSV